MQISTKTGYTTNGTLSQNPVDQSKIFSYNKHVISWQRCEQKFTSSSYLERNEKKKNVSQCDVQETTAASTAALFMPCETYRLDICVSYRLE